MSNSHFIPIFFFFLCRIPHFQEQKHWTVITVFSLDVFSKYELKLQTMQAKRVFYRGSRIWFAIVDELLAKGMNKAQNVFLSMRKTL